MTPLKSQHHVPLPHTSLFCIRQLRLCHLLQILSMASQSSFSLDGTFLLALMAPTVVLIREQGMLQLWPLPSALRLTCAVQWCYLTASFSYLVSSLEAINSQTSEIIFSIFVCMNNLLKFLLSLENSLRSFDTVRI